MTSTPRLVNAVLTLLRTTLPPLAAGEALPAVKRFNRHNPATVQAVNAPEVWVEVVMESRTLRAAGRSLVQAQGAQAVRLFGRSVDIGVTSAGADSDTAEEQLEGYADLIRLIMEGHPTVGGEAEYVKWLDTRYSPNFGQGTSLFREAVLTFEIARWSVIGQD